jgi:protein phosphatase
MATTIVACALRFDRLTVAHVGDSRCYLIRRGQAHPLTRDHTMVNEQLRLGVISSGEALRAQTRHVLSRSLGGEMFVKADTSEHHVSPKDVILLCSDGLHGAVSDDDIGRTVARSSSPQDAAKQLVDLANEQDGSDNVSIHVIRVRSTERVGMFRGRPYKLR